MEPAATRFVPFAARAFRSDLPASLVPAIMEAKWNHPLHHWRGLRLLKDPFTLAQYSFLLTTLRPRTILEFGTFQGGSALWMADILTAVSCPCDIHTYDIDIQSVGCRDPRVQIHQADIQRLDQFITPEFIASLVHPILVIEDCHVNVAGILGTFAHYLTANDYLIIEDTDKAKHDVLAAFFQSQPTAFLVDTWLCDMFGYNVGWNWNSFLVKT
jgi:cephalosporin hydroxylase